MCSRDNSSFLLQLDGRVKTLHPNIHGGILARRDQKHHMDALNEHGIGELYYKFFRSACVSVTLLQTQDILLLCANMSFN